MTEKKCTGPPPTRHGHNAWEAVSAVQKAIRRSQPDEAAYWAVELAAGNGHWLWKRLKTIAVEDCDPRTTGLVSDVAALHDQWKVSKGEDLMAVVSAAIRLALAPKSRLACWLTIALGNDSCPKRQVPDEALDRHTTRGKRMGRGYDHFATEGAKLVQPDGIDFAALEADAERRSTGLLLRGEQMTLDPGPGAS